LLFPHPATASIPRTPEPLAIDIGHERQPLTTPCARAGSSRLDIRSELPYLFICSAAEHGGGRTVGVLRMTRG